MIINVIINVLLEFLQLIVSPIPAVPAAPEAIVDGGAWIVSAISDVIGILRLVYGQTLLTALVVVFVGIYVFEWAYHSIMWIIRKIPMINMK